MKTPLTLIVAESQRLEATRQCGACTACCFLPRIQKNEDGLPLLPEGKIGYTACEHLGCTGCSRYEERPNVCRDFFCLWRSGHILGDERRRPDQLGVMFTAVEYDGRIVTEAWELWEGAVRDHPGRAIINYLFNAGYILMIRFYGVPCSLQYIGPDRFLLGERLSKMAREDPKALGQWLAKQVEMRNLESMDDEMTQSDVDLLESGTPVNPSPYKPL